MMAITLEGLSTLKMNKNRRFFVKILFFLIIFSLLSFNWIFLVGDFQSSALEEHYNINREINPSLLETVEWVQNRRLSEGFFRSLWLPFDPELKDSLRMIDPYVYYSPETWPFNLTGIIYSQTMEELEKGSPDISSLLGEASVKYVIIYKVSCYRDGSFSENTPSYYQQLFENLAEFKLIENNSVFSVFENSAFRPEISIYHDPVLVMQHNDTVSFASEVYGFKNGTSFLIDNAIPVAIPKLSSSNISAYIPNDGTYFLSLFGVPSSQAADYLRLTGARGESSFTLDFEQWEPSYKPEFGSVLPKDWTLDEGVTGQVFMHSSTPNGSNYSVGLNSGTSGIDIISPPFSPIYF